MTVDVSICACKSKKKPVVPTVLVCVIEQPPGSGCKCNKLSYDGVTARCDEHKDCDPARITGLSSHIFFCSVKNRRKGTGERI